jgi:hypothetical protein
MQALFLQLAPKTINDIRQGLCHISGIGSQAREDDGFILRLGSHTPGIFAITGFPILDFEISEGILLERG